MTARECLKQPADQRNLYLVGFMGSGKSAVGRSVASELGMRFIDSDVAIEAETGLSVSAIFDQFGEAHFRELEQSFIERGHPDCGCVVACGGGLITQEGMADQLRDRGVVICLFASVDTILQRTRANAKRPLLNVANPRAQIEKLLEERRPFYQQAGIAVSTDGRSLPEVVDHVAHIYSKATKS